MKEQPLGFMNDVISLRTLSAVFGIPGGPEAVEGLLLASGFLTGAYRSKNPHLPYKRYMDLGYFVVIDRPEPTKWKKYTFCITSRGLSPVLKKLQAFGVQIYDRVDH